MFLTDRFTYIHQPKTGGTFVATVLARVHQLRGETVRTVWFDPSGHEDAPDVQPGSPVRLMLTTRNQHGARRDIPARYLDRPILATIRNPYDRYVSQYEFAWWKVYPEMFGPVAGVKARYPKYPALTFAEFVELTNDVSVPYKAPRHPDDTPGFHTQQFAEFFFANPQAAYGRLNDPAFARDAGRQALGEIHFIDQSRLNVDLAAFLRGVGYADTDLDVILNADRIWPPEGGRPADASWEPYYTPDLKAFVRRKERWLFEWFPQYDV